MKNNILLAIAIGMLLIAGCTSSQPTRTTQNMQSSQKINNNKILLYFVHREGCPSCEYTKYLMKKPHIASLLKKEFTITMVNIRDKETLPHAWMRPYVTPTLYFLDSNKEELVSALHGSSEEILINTLKEAVQARDIK